MAPKKRPTRAVKKSAKIREAEETSDGSDAIEPPKKRTRNTRKKSDTTEDKEEKKPSTEQKEKLESEDPRPSSRRNSARKPTLLLDSINVSPTQASPSKTGPSISSRIPSPVKKNFNSRTNEPIDFNRTQTSSIQALQNKNAPKLVSIIDDLRATKQQATFDSFKNAMELKLEAADELISSLSFQNDQLQQELVDTRALMISESKDEPSTQKQNNQISEQDFLENELILDMMEQIVGLRIHRVEDTEEALFFDCSQSGKNGILDYRLSISKEDSSEIIYSPIENAEQNVDKLKEYLPDYFFDDLTFPLDTLQQFYHKIYRGLSK